MDLEPSIARYAWTVAIALALATIVALALPAGSAVTAACHGPRHVIEAGDPILAQI